MNKLERTYDIEIRADGDGNIVEGTAVVFDQPTTIGWFEEIIDRHAFDETDLSDVVLNYNHDDNYILAGTRNGSLQLWVDDNGVHQKSEIIDTTQGRDVMKLVRSHLISKQSFRFQIDHDGEKWETLENGMERRTITKVAKLWDVSLVVFPAYPQTSVFARDEDALAKEHRLIAEKRKAQDERWEEITNGKR